MYQYQPVNNPLRVKELTYFCGVPLYYSVNIAAAMGHLGNALAMVALYASDGQKDIEYQLTTSYASWDTADGTAPQPGDDFTISTQSSDVSTISLHWTIFFFHLLSFIFQMGALLPAYEYSKKVLEGRNPLRFIEYSLSASLMLIAIALLTGVRDVVILILICVATAACMFCGAACEYLPTGTLRLVTHLVGWVCILAAYMPILLYFFVANYQPHQAPTNPAAPDFLYNIVISQVLLSQSLGCAQPLQLYGKNWTFVGAIGREPEVAYTILSLTAKSILGWMIYANVIINGGDAPANAA